MSRAFSRAATRFSDRAQELLRRASLAVLGDDGRPLSLARLSTGHEGLDTILGGGLARGRVVELYGPPGEGKTSLALAWAAAAQRAGGTAAFVDVEGAFDPGRASAVGVDLARIVAARPAVGEEALEIVDALLRSRATDLVIIDSVAALVPREELRAPLGDTIGLHARLMSQALRRIVANAAASDTVVVFLNQQRTTFDDDGKAHLTTTGGHALHFYAATRLEVRRRGSELFVTVVKDRFGAEGRRVVL
jgi:recombination protein RecA